MTITIAMPQLGLTMTEATVSAWLKKPGDTIKKDEPILSVSTDKVDMDIESTVDGVLREIVVDQGQTVPVGTALAYVDEAGDEITHPVSPQTSPVTAAEEKPSLSLTATQELPAIESGEAVPIKRDSQGEGFSASPRAKRRANELGIDIASVKGSGPGGRVIEEDVLSFDRGRAAAPKAAGANLKRRQLIADRMVESARTIPPFTVSLEVNAEQFVSLYQSVKAPISQRAGSKLTYTDLLLRALALSLADTPEMNGVWKDGTVHPRSQVDLGLAVATDRGVVAPVLSRVDLLPLAQLVTRRAELAEKARESRLTFADLEGGTGTLSNLGMYRIDRFQGIISPGQSFILAAGKLRERPWVETTLVVKPTIILTLTVDHRVTDGAAAAGFLERIAGIIENPYRILWTEQNSQSLP